MTKSSSVKAVSLDVWETLLFERDGFDAERHRIRCANLSRVLEKHGVSVPIGKMQRALDSMHPWFREVWGRDEDVTHHDQLEFIVRAATDGTFEAGEGWLSSLSRAYTSAFHELPPDLNPDALPLLRWLKTRGIRLGITSNTGRTPGFVLRDFLEKEGLAEFFDAMIFSDEVGVRKPNPEIFHLLAERLKADLGSVVHIGDSLRSDVWGAKNAGMMAFHFSPGFGHNRSAQIDSRSLAPLEERWSASDPRVIEPEATITSLADTANAIQQLTRR